MPAEPTTLADALAALDDRLAADALASPASTAASIATPRACPSFSALRTLTA